MAKIKINGDSSGYVEIAAPNAANNNTLEIGSGTKILTNHNLNVGNVGIGTDNPTEKIHVSALGATDEPTIKISGENSSIFLRTAGSGGSFPTGGVGNDGELIYLGGDFRFGVGTASKNLIFFNGAGYTERLRIDSSGRVIIGTNSGSGNITLKLQGHSGNAAHDAKVRLCRGTDSPSDTNQLGAIFFSDNSESPSADIIAIRDGGTWSGSSKPGALKFSTTPDGAASPIERLRINSAGHTLPGADATQDLGSATKRWANIYSADLQLSNEGAANDVDGTWGQYTIQEGEDDLFLINRRSGKKYKFILQEVN